MENIGNSGHAVQPKAHIRQPCVSTMPGCGHALARKPSDFSGAQDAWRDWSTVFNVYAGAATPRLQKLMDDAAKVAAPIPNATIMDEIDRAASTELCWIDAHDLQGRTAQHRVPGSRQRRSRSLATTDREVRAEHGLQGK